MRRFRTAFSYTILPFVPLFIGMSLKFSLLDNVTLTPIEHFKENYLRGLWLELIAMSYIGVIVWGYSNAGKVDAEFVKNLIVTSIVPAFLFVVCLLFSLGLPKINAASNLVILWMPNLLGVASVIFTSFSIKSSTAKQIASSYHQDIAGNANND